MKAFSAIHGALSRLSLWAVWTGGAALMLAAIMVTIDVILRKSFDITMSGSDEISGYVFAGATTWAYAYCLLHRSNIRIDALYNLLPMVLRALLDIIGLTLLLVYMAFLTWKGIDVFATSWARDSVSISSLAIPLWIPQLIWLSGLVFFNITLVFLIIHCAVSWALAGAGAVQALAGTMSVQEEVADSTRGILELER